MAERRGRRCTPNNSPCFTTAPAPQFTYHTTLNLAGLTGSGLPNLQDTSGPYSSFKAQGVSQVGQGRLFTLWLMSQGLPHSCCLARFPSSRSSDWTEWRRRLPVSLGKACTAGRSYCTALPSVNSAAVQAPVSDSPKRPGHRKAAASFFASASTAVTLSADTGILAWSWACTTRSC